MACILLIIIIFLVVLSTYIIEISGIGQIVNNIGLGWIPFDITIGSVLCIIVFYKWHDIENLLEKIIGESRRQEKKEHLNHQEELRKQTIMTQEILEILKPESDGSSLFASYNHDFGQLQKSGEALVEELDRLSRMTKNEMIAYFSNYSEEEIYKYSVVWYGNRELEQSAMGYEIIIERDPNHVGALNDLGAICSSMGKYDDAVKYLEMALLLDPTSSIIHSNLGLVYRNLGRFDVAEKTFLEGMNSKPVYIGVFVNYSTLLRRQGRTDEALQISQKGVEAYPRHFEALTELGRVFVDRGDISKALHWLKKAERLIQNEVPLPEHSWVYENFAHAYYKLNDLRTAYKYLKLAVSLEDSNPESTHNLAVIASKLGHWAQLAGKSDEAGKYFKHAEENYEKAITLDPEEPANHVHFAAMLISAGRQEDALEEARRAYKMKPEESIVQNLYLACLAVNMRMDEMSTILKGEIPSDPFVLSAVVLSYMTRGELRRLKAPSEGTEEVSPLTEEEALALRPYVEKLAQISPESEVAKSLLNLINGTESHDSSESD